MLRLQCQCGLQRRQRLIPHAAVVQAAPRLRSASASLGISSARASQRLQGILALVGKRDAQHLPQHPGIGVGADRLPGLHLGLGRTVLVQQ